jgi:diacylglycerol kinase (ATP)
MKRAQLIVNPISGRGRGLGVVPAIEARLLRLGYRAATCITRQRGDARDFVASLDWRTSLIVVVGGDGTLNEVINGQTKIPLALFPVGTGNAFAADQGILGNLDFLERLIQDGRVEWFALGDAGGKKFLNMASGGILGQIHRTFWEHRNGPDSVARSLARALRILWRRQFPPVSVWCDDTPVTRTARIVVVGNTRTYARHIRFTPLASPFDGSLDVCTFPVPSGLDYLRWLLAVLRGRHVNHDGVGYLRGRTIRLAGDGVACHVDGEYVGQAPLNVSVLPASVPILVLGSRPASQEALRAAA